MMAPSSPTRPDHFPQESMHPLSPWQSKPEDQSDVTDDDEEGGGVPIPAGPDDEDNAEDDEEGGVAIPAGRGRGW